MVFHKIYETLNLLFPVLFVILAAAAEPGGVLAGVHQIVDIVLGKVVPHIRKQHGRAGEHVHDLHGERAVGIALGGADDRLLFAAILPVGVVIEQRLLHVGDAHVRLFGHIKLAGEAAQPQRAARLFGAAAALRERIGIPIPAVERADYDAAVAQARAQLDPAAFDAAWAEGLAMNWEQATAYALET